MGLRLGLAKGLAMSVSNSGDSMQGGRGRSSGSRKGKRTGSSSCSDRPRPPQRGLGVAQLEKIRIESEMAEYLHHPLGHHRPPIHRTSRFNLEDVRSAHSMPPSPSSSFHANISISSSYPIHRPNLAAYGERGDIIRYGDFQTNPVISLPNYHGTSFDSEGHYSHHQSNVTLPLFGPEGSICLKRRHNVNQSADSLNSEDDQQEVDLELKL